MSSAPATTQPDAGTLCNSIYVLARLNVAQAYKNGREIAPAAEMTVSGLQDSETEAFDTLQEVYAIAYQQVADKVQRPLSRRTYIQPVDYTIDTLVDLAAFLGAYQASEDMRAGFGMERSERLQDVGEEVFRAALEVARRAVKEYHEVCASHYLWEVENAERVLRAEDIARVEKGEEGVVLVMKNSAKHVVVDKDVSAAVYSRLLAAAGEMRLEEEGQEGEEGGGRGGGIGAERTYPAVNASTASEILYD